jgi:nucleoid-associated protein YgaU
VYIRRKADFPSDSGAHMDSRRRNGLIALVALLVLAGGLIYYQSQTPPRAPTTAFAPAESADESVPPPDEPIEAPDAAPAGEADGPGAAAASDSTAAETAATTENGAAADGSAVAPAPESAAAETPTEPAGSATADAAVEPPGTDAASDSEAAPVESEVAMADPAAGSEPEPAPVPVPEPLPVPTFDIVRVEPSGETVIAGQAEPNALVEIMDGAEVVASAEANDAGEWAIALDAPLSPGTHDLAISTTSADESVVTLSDERVTVSVPEEGSSDVLVVLNAPNEPTTVLQLPPVEQEVAAAPGADATAQPGSPATQPGATVEQEVAVGPSAGEDAPVSEETDIAAADAPSAEAPSAPSLDEPGQTAASGTGAEQPAMSDGEAPAETDVAAAATAADEAAQSTAEETASAEQGRPSTGEDVASVPADTVETDSGAASSAPAESDVAAGAPDVAEQELALASPAEPDPETSGTSAAADGDEAAATPAADVAPDGALDAAETAAATGDASAGEEQTAGNDAGAPEVAAAPPEEVEPAPPPPPEPAVVVAAVEAETDGSLYVAGTATTGETVRVYVDGEYIGDAIPSPSGTWLIETTADLPAGEYLVRADQVADDGSVVARYEVPFDWEVEVAVLEASGSAEGTATASLEGAMPEMETVIIKRGDNLWRIARAAWGRGIRWSTIYQANTDQIGDPDLIYPGQVFVMPKGDAAWQN